VWLGAWLYLEAQFICVEGHAVFIYKYCFKKILHMKTFSTLIALFILICLVTSKKATAQTCTTPTPFPYLETFNAPLAVDSIPTCSAEEMLSIVGNWGAASGGLNTTQCLKATKEYIRYMSSAFWYTPKFQLFATHSFRFSYYFKSTTQIANDAPKLTVYYGSCQQATCMTNYLSGGAVPVTNISFLQTSLIFTPTSSGEFYIGFKAREVFPETEFYDTPISIVDVYLEDLGPLNAPASPLKGTANESATEIFWQTYSESNNQGFEILESADGTSFTKIGFVP